MKTMKRTVLTILILTTIGFIFRKRIYRHLVTYRSPGPRNIYSATNDKLIDYIDKKSEEQTDLDIEQIIKLRLSITSSVIATT